MSVLERNRIGGLDCLCQADDKSEWRVLLYIVMCNRVHRELCQYIDTLNIVFTFLYAIFYNCHHPLGFLKGEEFLDYWSSHKNPLIKLYYTTTHEINKIIHSLKCKDSYGYDEISTKIIKLSAAYILFPLTYTFNKILSTGTFPDRLQFSEARPLFKNGSTTEFSNYRPIALLPSFSRIIEKIIYKRLYRYFTEHNILLNEQFGFRENLSTDKATYSLLNSVLLSLDKKKHCWWPVLRPAKGFRLR